MQSGKQLSTVPESSVLILCCVLLSIKSSEADADHWKIGPLSMFGLFNPQCWFPVVMVSVTSMFTLSFLLLSCVSPVATAHAPNPYKHSRVCRSHPKYLVTDTFLENMHLVFQPFNQFKDVQTAKGVGWPKADWHERIDLNEAEPDHKIILYAS